MKKNIGTQKIGKISENNFDTLSITRFPLSEIEQWIMTTPIIKGKRKFENVVAIFCLVIVTNALNNLNPLHFPNLNIDASVAQAVNLDGEHGFSCFDSAEFAFDAFERAADDADAVACLEDVVSHFD